MDHPFPPIMGFSNDLRRSSYIGQSNKKCIPVSTPCQTCCRIHVFNNLGTRDKNTQKKRKIFTKQNKTYLVLNEIWNEIKRKTNPFGKKYFFQCISASMFALTRIKTCQTCGAYAPAFLYTHMLPYLYHQLMIGQPNFFLIAILSFFLFFKDFILE